MSASSDLLNGNNVDCEQLSLLLKNNWSRLIFADLNINYITNKFDQLVHGIKGNANVFFLLFIKNTFTMDILIKCKRVKLRYL